MQIEFLQMMLLVYLYASILYRLGSERDHYKTRMERWKFEADYWREEWHRLRRVNEKSISEELVEIEKTLAQIDNVLSKEDQRRGEMNWKGGEE